MYLVMGGPLDNLLEDGGIHIGQWNHFIVLKTVLSKDKALYKTNFHSTVVGTY
jgi:hypothetical protein